IKESKIPSWFPYPSIPFTKSQKPKVSRRLSNKEIKIRNSQVSHSQGQGVLNLPKVLLLDDQVLKVPDHHLVPQLLDPSQAVQNLLQVLQRDAPDPEVHNLLLSRGVLGLKNLDLDPGHAQGVHNQEDHKVQENHVQGLGLEVPGQGLAPEDQGQDQEGQGLEVPDQDHVLALESHVQGLGLEVLGQGLAPEDQGQDQEDQGLEVLGPGQDQEGHGLAPEDQGQDQEDQGLEVLGPGQDQEGHGLAPEDQGQDQDGRDLAQEGQDHVQVQGGQGLDLEDQDLEVLDQGLDLENRDHVLDREGLGQDQGGLGLDLGHDPDLVQVVLGLEGHGLVQEGRAQVHVTVVRVAVWWESRKSEEYPTIQKTKIMV
ncbi:spore wall protein 2-like, partial [Diaphorina citri]|uniref:Spore wall protein 2-like n=1 Tax=Diaphorina citri TaxID=121845 RepID=A0A3Q0JJZ1_DIACI